MNLLPCFVGMKIMRLEQSALLMGFCCCASFARVEAEQQMPPASDDGAIPQAMKGEEFEALFASSPFTRSLGVSDSIILTGIAHIEGDVFATLFDTQTMESQVVSKTANLRGWQLIGVGGNTAESRTWTAKIQVAGGQVISVRYQQPPKKTVRVASGNNGPSGSSGGNSPPLNSSQMAEAKNAAVNYKEGFTSDGYPNAPPPEMVQKLSRLSVGQREDINRQMLGLRNQGLGMNERRKIYENLVEKAGQGRR